MISRSYVCFSIVYFSLENGSRVFFGFLSMCYEIAILFYTIHLVQSQIFSENNIYYPLWYTHITDLF